MNFLSFRMLAATSVVIVVTWIGQRRRRWDRTMATLESKLLKEKPTDAKQSRARSQQWENLPPPVQRYFRRVFQERNSSSAPPSVPSLRLVRFHQKGEFCLNNRWLPFTARQIMSANAPGFLWEASISMGAFVWIQVCDALVGGDGYLQASLFGAIPIISLPKHEEDKEHLFIGEALRWLAEAPLVPTALLPEQGIVQWSQVPESDQKAKMSLTDPPSNEKLELIATFDLEEGYLTKVEGWRPAADDKGGFVSKRWIGRFTNYQAVEHDMLVPKHMEAGWIEDGKEKLYFMGDVVEDLTYGAAAASVVKQKVTTSAVRF